METVPQMISTKDLAYISDMFDWNYIAYKQIHHYLGEVKQEEIKDLLESVMNMHYNHLLTLKSILKGDKERFDMPFDEEDESNEG